jgi:hypothetical protein
VTMRPLAFAALLLALDACRADAPPTYDNGTLELLVVHTAKDACTCRYVMERSHDQCVDFVRAAPDVASFAEDDAAREVTARVLGAWTARARFIDDRFGCELVER